MEQKDPISIVHDIFNDFFGENNVDLQGQTLIVHFPEVTVTNEHNRSVTIKELWAKINLGLDGTISGTFGLMRSEYTSEQFNSGYAHSHIPGRGTSNFNQWGDPCLGDGPIRDTIASLTRQFSEEMWGLFCLELSKYVTVESLAGTPYMYLEKIGNNGSSSTEVSISNYTVDETVQGATFLDVLNKFIPYVIGKRPFKFNYFRGSYGIAMPMQDIVVVLSNLFIEWYNSTPSYRQTPRDVLFSTGILQKAKYVNNKLHYIVQDNGGNRVNYSNIIGRDLFRFKNRNIKLNIVDVAITDDPNESILLTSQATGLIVDRILRTINYKYGNQRREETPATGKALRYI